MTNLELIAYAEQNAQSGTLLTHDQIVQLLSIEPESAEWSALGVAARRVAHTLTGDRAYLWGAIGVDFTPCSMNCDFCSLGEKWGIVRETRSYDARETVAQVREYAEAGVRWIVLRTTEFYSQDALGDMIRTIRAEVPGDYEIGLNIGEFDLAKANWLADCGVDFIYHSLRLGEGKDTRFDPKVRLSTLQAVKDSPLKLVFLVEPVGIEHTNEEIADLILLTAQYGAIVSGSMARIPVAGTPLGIHPQVSDARMAQIIAVTRLACGSCVPDICIHPGGSMARIPVAGTPLGIHPQVSDARMAQIIAVTRLACGSCVPDICIHPGTRLAMEFGANVTVIETGSVPRDTCCCSGGKWNQFDAARAKELFAQAGYTVHQTA